MALNASGELARRAAQAWVQLESCDLVLDARGVALRGLLVRHLILPQGIAAGERVFRFIAEEISVETYLNVMDQYRPCYRAGEYPHSTVLSRARNSDRRSSLHAALASLASIMKTAGSASPISRRKNAGGA